NLENGILLGAGEIALPAMVSTLCICIVFVPMFFLTGVARFLFAPLAEAVVFAVLASYALSRTLVPTLVMWFEKTRAERGSVERESVQNTPRRSDAPRSTLPGLRQLLGIFVALQHRFEQAFDRFRRGYHNWLGAILNHRLMFVALFLGFCVCSWLLVPFLGQDFFPSVDAGTFRLHMRAHTGTRLEETAVLVDHVEATIRREIPAKELQGIIDNLGIPISGINLSYNDSGTAGPPDVDMKVFLNTGHRPTAAYVRNLRLALNRDFPGVTFYFLPADIVSQTI